MGIRKTFLSLRWLPGACSSFFPFLIPPAHIAILFYFWQSYARIPIRNSCSCSCWDTVFKGTYESGIASYKHMYFNATRNTMKMWILIVGGVICLYECNKHLITLMVTRRVRYEMVVLFLSSIFSHYYSWWAYLNYYNDDYYSQWNHQLFFTLTELLSTAVVLHLANTENAVTSRKTLLVVGISLLHIIGGGFDQFISNVFQGEGYPHQVVRDLGFMIPDLLHLIVPILVLIENRKDSYLTVRPFYKDRQLQKDVLFMFLFDAILLTICSFL